MFDMRPTKRALITVVVGRVDGFGDALSAGNFGNWPAVLDSYIRTKDTRKRAMVAFDAHDARGGNAQIACAEIADADQVGGDECVF